jgi:hypothetical protein
VTLVFFYPDWVTQTEFVHGAKKMLPVVPEFCVKFLACVSGIYVCKGRMRTFNIQITNRILYQCVTASLKNNLILRQYFQHGFHGIFLLTVAGTHADAEVSSVGGLPVTGVQALALVHAVAGTNAFADVSICFWPYRYWYP